MVTGGWAATDGVVTALFVTDQAFFQCGRESHQSPAPQARRTWMDFPACCNYASVFVLHARFQRHQLMRCKLGEIQVVLLEEGFRDGFVDLIGCGLLTTHQRGEPGRAKIPLCCAPPAQTSLHIAAWIDRQQHGHGRTIPALFPQASADRV